MVAPSAFLGLSYSYHILRPGTAVPHLYVVATPIGNLEDVTLRALRILSEARLIAAEDTRTTRKLLARYGIRTPLVSFHEHNREARIPQILDTLKDGDVALVSEAGVPTLSDRGRELVRLALETGIRVLPVPGPSALTAALWLLPIDGLKSRVVGALALRNAYN